MKTSSMSEEAKTGPEVVPAVMLKCEGKDVKGCYKHIYATGMKPSSNSDKKLSKKEQRGDANIATSKIPFRALKASNYLQLYDQTPRPPSTLQLVSNVPDDVANDIWDCYKDAVVKEKKTIAESIREAAIRMWTIEDAAIVGSPSFVYRRINAALISDNWELLSQWTYLIRTINYHIVDSRPTKAIVCYRKSAMDASQLQNIRAAGLGAVFRMGMYCATSTKQSFVNNWQRGNGLVMWEFRVPKGSYNACHISELSKYSHESEVLMPPYTAIKILDIRSNDGKAGKFRVVAEVLENRSVPLDCRTILG